MGEYIFNNVVCCFCGESLLLANARIEEAQRFFAHKHHFTEKINKAIPLHPNFSK